jgi:hypothetical protein
MPECVSLPGLRIETWGTQNVCSPLECLRMWAAARREMQIPHVIFMLEILDCLLIT